MRGGLFWKQVVKHEHIRLLQHLRARSPLGSEEHVRGDRSAGSDLSDYERLEIMKARELFVDSARAVVSVNQCIGDRQPSTPLPLSYPG